MATANNESETAELCIPQPQEACEIFTNYVLNHYSEIKELEENLNEIIISQEECLKDLRKESDKCTEVSMKLKDMIDQISFYKQKLMRVREQIARIETRMVSLKTRAAVVKKWQERKAQKFKAEKDRAQARENLLIAKPVWEQSLAKSQEFQTNQTAQSADNSYVNSQFQDKEIQHDNIKTESNTSHIYKREDKALNNNISTFLPTFFGSILPSGNLQQNLKQCSEEIIDSNFTVKSENITKDFEMNFNKKLSSNSQMKDIQTKNCHNVLSFNKMPYSPDEIKDSSGQSFLPFSNQTKLNTQNTNKNASTQSFQCIDENNQFKSYNIENQKNTQSKKPIFSKIFWPSYSLQDILLPQVVNGDLRVPYDSPIKQTILPNVGEKYLTNLSETKCKTSKVAAEDSSTHSEYIHANMAENKDNLASVGYNSIHSRAIGSEIPGPSADKKIMLNSKKSKCSLMSKKKSRVKPSEIVWEPQPE